MLRNYLEIFYLEKRRRTIYVLRKEEKNNICTDTKSKQSKGFFSNQEGYLWCEPDNPNIESGWYEIDIGNYVSAKERNKQDSDGDVSIDLDADNYKPCGRPQLQRGIYHFTMKNKTNGSDEWSDYFSDYDETDCVNGNQGDDIWGSR